MPAETAGKAPTIGELFAIDAEVAPPGPTGRVSSMPGRARRLPSKPRAGDIRIKSTLIRYTTDGRLEMSNNAAERAIHPPFLGGKKFSSPAATAAGSCRKNVPSPSRPEKMNGFDPLGDVFERIADHAISKIDELLPGNRKPTG
jgi:hypothetical protein